MTLQRCHRAMQNNKVLTNSKQFASRGDKGAQFGIGSPQQTLEAPHPLHLLHAPSLQQGARACAAPLWCRRWCYSTPSLTISARWRAFVRGTLGFHQKKKGSCCTPAQWFVAAVFGLVFFASFHGSASGCMWPSVEGRPTAAVPDATCTVEVAQFQQCFGYFV